MQRRRAMQFFLVMVVAATVLAPDAASTSRVARSPAWPPTILTNGGFEDGSAAPAGWTFAPATPTAGSAWESAVAKTGTRSVSTTGAGTWKAAPVPSGPEGAYRAVSGWFRTPTPRAPGDGAALQVSWLDDSGAEISQSTLSDVAGTCTDYYYTWAGPWCFSMRALVVPARAVSAVVSVNTAATNTSKWYFDDVTFGPTVDRPEAGGSQFHSGTPAGTATVDVDATKVIRQIPRTMFGNGLQWKDTSLLSVADDVSVTKVIRDQATGSLRFPGGVKAHEYDWEHPFSATAPTATDIDTFMRYVRATGAEDVMYTLNVSGIAPIFTVGYTGTATAARLTIAADSLRVDLSGDQIDGTSDLEIAFSPSTTAGQVVDAIRATPGYTATMSSEERRRDPVFEELVPAEGVNAKPVDAQVSVDLGNVHKSERLVDYANNPASTVMGPSGKTRDATLASRGLPTGPYNIRYFEVGNETFFIGEPGPLSETSLDPRGSGRQAARFARALKAVYPSFPIQIGMPAVSFNKEAVSNCCGGGGAQWVFNVPMFEEAGAEIDFLVDHLYEQFHTTMGGLQSWPQHQQRVQVTRMLQEQFARYSPDHRRNIPVYNTEFNLVTFGTFTFYGATSPNYQLVNGLVAADVLGVWQHLGVQGTNIHAQIDYPFATNILFGPAGNRTVATQATGYALEMYNRHWGTQLIGADYRSPTYDVPAPDAGERSNSMSPGGSGFRYPFQSAYASLNGDRSKLYLMLINKSGVDPAALEGSVDMPLATGISLKGFTPIPQARVWTLTAAQLSTANAIIIGGPGQGTGYDPKAITLKESSFLGAGKTFTYTTPPHSATMIELTRAPL